MPNMYNIYILIFNIQYKFHSINLIIKNGINF